MRFILLLSTLMCAACANNSPTQCGDKFLLPWLMPDKSVQFQKVHLTTLKSPYRLKGSAAEVYYESMIDDRGYQGPVAEPHLTRSDGTCVPTDAGSVMALTAYAHFERIYLFDREIGVANQLTWPRKVGVQIHLRTPEGMDHNNAHYFGRSDSVGVIPYTRKGMHFAMNRGILAHEHFHAHFQSQVLNALNRSDDVINSLYERIFHPLVGIKPTIEDLDNADVNTNEGLNRFVLRSWNEGLADFYAGVLTEDPDFFADSSPELSDNRTLDGPLWQFNSGAILRQKSRLNMLYDSYFQGTILARTLFRMAHLRGTDPKQFLSAVMKRMIHIPRMVRPLLETQIIDFESVLPVLLEGEPLNEERCLILRTAVSKSGLLRSFRQCGT